MKPAVSTCTRRIRDHSNGELLAWHLNDDARHSNTNFPVSIMQLRNSNDFVPPKYQKFLQLKSVYDGRKYALEQDSPRELLDAFNWHLHHCDPTCLLPITETRFCCRKSCSCPDNLIYLYCSQRFRAQHRTTKESSFLSVRER